MEGVQRVLECRAPVSDWRPTPVSELPDWAGAKRVAIDVETRDDQLRKLGPGVRRDGYVVGYSFAIEDGPSHYVPFRHEAGEDNLDEAQALAYLRAQAACFKGILVGANLSYDLDYLAELGIHFSPSWYRDIQIAEPLIDELQMSYSLENIAGRYGLPGKDETMLRQAADVFGIDPKSEMWRLPGRYVGVYAERDTTLPLHLLRLQERRIADDEIQGIFDLESRLLPALLRMRRRGVAINFDQLDRVEQWAMVQEIQALKEIKAKTGIQVSPEDVWKADVVAPVLENIGVKVPLTPKTRKPSVKRDWLNTLDHEVARDLIAARVANKLRTTFVASMRRYETNGRIHCSFNQLRATRDENSDDDERGTRYGRLSSSDPNLQQQPIRSEMIGPMWRKVFIPDEGALWACNDYSQQEPRWVCHFAELLNLPKGKQAAERYRTDPTTDNHTMMAEMIHGEKQWAEWGDGSSNLSVTQKHHRSNAKTIYLGLIYGMGGGKLCRSLGYETEWIRSNKTGGMVEVAGPEGRALLAQFDEGAPFLRKLSYKASDRAKQVGYIRTAGGRVCRFPRKQNGDVDWSYKALNRLIQGSSADQMKQAVVDADAAGFKIQLQVHDELDLSVESPQEAIELAGVMREAMSANVPFKVDVELGPSWGEISEIES